MTNFLRKTAEKLSFGHHYGGLESSSRMSMNSVDSSGKVWTPEGRHLMKVTVAVGIGGLAYEVSQIAELFGLI